MTSRRDGRVERDRVGRRHPEHAPFDVTGHPAMNVPCAMSDGLPVGMMLVARHGDEATILRAADAFEREIFQPPAPPPAG